MKLTRRHLAIGALAACARKNMTHPRESLPTTSLPWLFLRDVAGDAAMPLRCDVRVWWLDVVGRRSVEVPAGRQGYLLVLTGRLQVGPDSLAEGDGAEVSSGALSLEGAGAVLLIDLRA
jgi:redox-sensitive bicupin YhaK (pirin superfamily)